jgi:hypothetical protein
MSKTVTQSGGTIFIRTNLSNGLTMYTVGSNNLTMDDSLTIINTSSKNMLTVKFESSISIDNDKKYFICGSNNIIFDGGMYEIKINTKNYLGLISNNNKKYSNITLKNLNIVNILKINDPKDFYLNTGAGYLCRQGFGGNNTSIEGCRNSGPIDGKNSGGICGANCSISRINSCSNSGVIMGEDAGGICGAYLGNGLSITVDNCYNSGNIVGVGSGGICGKSGNISTDNKSSNNVSVIQNCYNVCQLINGNYAGGICGRNSDFNINNCFSIGVISGIGAGGICGSHTGLKKSTVLYCYSTGEIKGEGAGGICGSNAGCSFLDQNPYNIYDDYGPYIENSPRMLIIQLCYSIGAISGKNAGGICGEKAIVDDSVTYDGNLVRVTNCYSSGSHTGGGIYGNGKGSKAESVKNYDANGNWLNTDANQILEGIPQPSNKYIGIYWTDTSKGQNPNQPYILTK